LSLDPSISEKSQRQQKPTTLQTYSDDYENTASTISSTPINHKQIPQKPRVIQQPIPSMFTKSTKLDVPTQVKESDKASDGLLVSEFNGNY
jgi:hypothetical protein